MRYSKRLSFFFVAFLASSLLSRNTFAVNTYEQTILNKQLQIASKQKQANKTYKQAASLEGRLEEKFILATKLLTEPCTKETIPKELLRGFVRQPSEVNELSLKSISGESFTVYFNKQTQKAIYITLSESFVNKKIIFNYLNQHFQYTGSEHICDYFSNQKINLHMCPFETTGLIEIGVEKEMNSVESTIIGTARNAKLGAMLEDTNGNTFIIENLSSWTEQLLNKRVAVKGLIVEKSFDKPLVNEQGEHIAGIQGKVQYIKQAKLPQLIDEKGINSIVVFRKNVSSSDSDKWMQAKGYPFSEGADSSKGKLYFYDSGKMYFMLFPNNEEQHKFTNRYQSDKQIKEIYSPSWVIQKD